MSRLRDGTAESVSRDQIVRHVKGQGKFIFPVQLTTSRIVTRFNPYSAICNDHTYINTYILCTRGGIVRRTYCILLIF